MIQIKFLGFIVTTLDSAVIPPEIVWFLSGIFSLRLKRDKPDAICVDNVPEYISATLEVWATQCGIKLMYIKSGKLQQNAHVERYNQTVRQDWLGQYNFDTLEQIRHHATRWFWTYNTERPSMGIGGITPSQKFKQTA